MKLPVLDATGKELRQLDVDDSVFGIEPNGSVLHQAFVTQRNNQRSGSANTKTRAQVRGSTAKIRKQKYTGRARQGSSRAAQMRGGATTHGPQSRDHSHGLPKKVRRLALKTALSVKQAAGKLTILDAAALPDAKTAALSHKLDALGWGSVLIIDGPEVDQNLARAAANLPGIDVLPQQGVNVYDILRCDTLALTKAAVEHLHTRLK